MLDADLDDLGGLGRGRVLAGLLGGSYLLQSLLLRLLILRWVFDKHLEEFGGLVFVQRLAELIDAIFRCLCRRMYLGHITNRDTSTLGWMSRPMRKLFLRAGKRGSSTSFGVDLTGFLTCFLETPMVLARIPRRGTGLGNV